MIARFGTIASNRLVLVVAVLAAVAPVRAETPLGLTVRIYVAADLSPADVTAAMKSAEPILRDTGLDVTFRRCARAGGEAGGVVDRCDDPLEAHELVVRVIDAPKDSSHLDPLALGLTYVVPETNGGWLATVFADRVLSTAERVGMDRGTLAGLVLAHEVGHLLLGEAYHGNAGVMRADWPDHLLAGSANGTWRFSTTEAAAMQQRLITR
jgi:hypothetical protein